MESRLDIDKFIASAKEAQKNGVRPYTNSIAYMQQLGKNIDLNMEKDKVEKQTKSEKMVKSKETEDEER